MKKSFLVLGVSASMFGILGCADNTGRNQAVGRGVNPYRPAVADISPSAPTGYIAGGSYNPAATSYGSYSPAGNYAIGANTLTPIQPVQPIQPIQPIAVQPIDTSANTAGFTQTPAVSAELRSNSGTYTVQKGDTLTKIARKQYGHAGMWTKIAAANPNLNANSIRVGQKIVLP